MRGREEGNAGGSAPIIRMLETGSQEPWSSAQPGPRPARYPTGPKGKDPVASFQARWLLPRLPLSLASAIGWVGHSLPSVNLLPRAPDSLGCEPGNVAAKQEPRKRSFGFDQCRYGCRRGAVARQGRKAYPQNHGPQEFGHRSRIGRLARSRGYGQAKRSPSRMTAGSGLSPRYCRLVGVDMTHWGCAR